MHVLVVDDDRDLLLLFRVSLESEGHTVTQAGTGPAAIAAATQERFDLILLDMMLPGQDGFEVLASLASDPSTQGTPVVVISARTAVDDQIRSLDAGAVSYLPKPFSIDGLLGLVAEIGRMDQAGRDRLRDETRARLVPAEPPATTS